MNPIAIQSQTFPLATFDVSSLEHDGEGDFLLALDIYEEGEVIRKRAGISREKLRDFCIENGSDYEAVLALVVDHPNVEF